MDKGTALVAGITGLAGWTLATTLAKEGWKVIGIARTPFTRECPDNIQVYSADLMRKDSLAFLRDTGITHLFYAAHYTGNHQERLSASTTRFGLFLDDIKLRCTQRLWPLVKKAVGSEEANRYLSRVGRIDAVTENLTMFRNILETLISGGTLSKVVLVTGGRHYSHHIGPFCPSYSQPFVEDMPRSSGPNWYHAVEDYLTERQIGEKWHWVVLRPSALIGTVAGGLYNLASCLGAYAAALKEQGLPLLFPGTPRAFRTRFDVTSTDQLAAAALWAAETPGVKNEAFNVTASVPVSWATLWPKLAALFDMEMGSGFYYPIRGSVGNLDELWRTMAGRRNLRQSDAGNVFNAYYLHSLTNQVTWDCRYSNEKRVAFGHVDSLHGESIVIDAIRWLQRDRIIPFSWRPEVGSDDNLAVALMDAQAL